MLSAEQITEFSRDAEPGDTLIYHTGFLARDRVGMGIKFHDLTERNRMGHAANIALGLAAKGKLILVQRRVNREVFQYLAVKAGGKS